MCLFYRVLYSITLLLWHLVMLNVSILLWLPSPFECVEHSFIQNWCYVSFITVNVTKYICMHLHAHTYKHTMHTYVPTHTYTYTEREGEGEIFKNWLTWLWSLASLKFVGQAHRLETQPVFDAAVLRQNFSSGKTLYFVPEAFTRLDEAHPHHWSQSSLPKVNWLKMLLQEHLD